MITPDNRNKQKAKGCAFLLLTGNPLPEKKKKNKTNHFRVSNESIRFQTHRTVIFSASMPIRRVDLVALG